MDEKGQDDSTQATLQEAALRELVNAHVVTGFVARGNDSGFVVEATLGNEPRKTAVLGNSRNGQRVFASLQTVALLLRRMGFDQFLVETSKYAPGRVRAARPDRSEALKAVNSDGPPPAKKPASV